MSVWPIPVVAQAATSPSIGGHAAMAYLVAAVCFILSLRGLSDQETARRGNLLGALGMLIAVAATLTTVGSLRWSLALGGLAAGALVGLPLAMRVAMTAMPELVALLHSFVGLAAVLIGVAAFVDPRGEGGLVHRVEVYADVWIGGITFTGSVIAFGKLRGFISGRPLLLPARHVLNALMLLASIGVAVPAVRTGMDGGLVWLLGGTVLSFVLGAHLVAAIGGADMPVVISMLNSYLGWAAAAAGFMLGNDLLIVTGALVGSSGAILSYIMCRAMNRKFLSVILGGFGTAGGKPASAGGEAGDVQRTNATEVAGWLKGARKVLVVPGYGLAVAQAQHLVKELADLLRSQGTDIKFAIHPVAGRLPGHMNVLLAEAGVPYDIVYEMDDVAGEFAQADVALVVGANDIVNPGALTDPTSPIFGMPVLPVWEAQRVVVFKRSLATGYAGVDNPLYYKPNTWMFFGNARDTLAELVTALRSA